MVNIQDLPNEILLDICEELEHIYIITKLRTNQGTEAKNHCWDYQSSVWFLDR